MPSDNEPKSDPRHKLTSWLPLFEGMATSFLELDAEEKIIRVYGDPSVLLGAPPAGLAGEKFSRFIHDRDLALWRLVLERLKNKAAIAPFPIRTMHSDATVGAIEITVARALVGGERRYQLAIGSYLGQLSIETAKRPASTQEREFQKEDFEALASRLERYAAENNEDAISTLLRLAGISKGSVSRSDGEPRIGTDVGSSGSGAEGLWAAYKLLKDAASEHAAEISAKSKRIAHDQKGGGDRAATVASHGNNMKVAVRSAYKKGDDTNYVTVAGEDGISEAEAVKAAVYAMKQAASSERAVTMKALTGGYERRLEKVRNQLRVFKKIVVQEKFEVALQPIVNLSDSSVHHFEALARFDSKFYSGSPFEFMCFAEDVGVIHEFDLAMTMKVVSLLKRVRRIGFNTNIAVNISGRSIQSQAFLRHFFRILEDCGDVRNQLSFELTESSQIDDLETTNRVLSRIRDFGHKVALDDFGAGAAGLQYLRVLKVDYVKIDGIYVRKALEDSENRAFLKSIAELCAGLGIETIGECIEVDLQQKFLSSIGVGYGQGWLFGKPLPVDEALTAFSG